MSATLRNVYSYAELDRVLDQAYGKERSRLEELRQEVDDLSEHFDLGLRVQAVLMWLGVALGAVLLLVAL